MLLKKSLIIVRLFALTLLTAATNIGYADTPYALSMSTYLGDTGDTEDAVGVRIQSNGTIVLAANMGSFQPEQLTDPELTPVLLGGATGTTQGVILRLSRDGQNLLSVTRLADSLRAMEIDDSDNIYVAAGPQGLFKLNPTADTIAWHQLDGLVIHRVSASPSGWVAAHRPNNTDAGSIDSTPGAGETYLFDPTGTQTASFSGLRNTLDVAVDEVSQTLIQIGWRQANAWQHDGSGTLPVQIAYMRGLDFAGNVKWHSYDWEANGTIGGGNDFVDDFIVITNPLYINSTGQPIGVDDQGRTTYGFLNNMADTRGYRVRVGRDGLLYAAFEAAGGNHIFRYQGTRDSADPIFRKGVTQAGGDVFHSFINTGAGHKTYIGRYNPATGEIATGNEFNTVVTTNNSAGANTLRIRSGGLAVDENGQLFFGSDAASGLPFASNQYFNSNNSPDQYSLDPYGLQETTGGAYIWGMNTAMNKRLLIGRLGPGATRSVDARILDGETEPLIVYAGRAGLDRPMLTKEPLQQGPGYGTQDIFLVVLGGEEQTSVSGRLAFSYGGSGVSYTTTGTRLRGVVETRYAADVDGDGSVDDRIAEYAWNPDIALSPPAPNYSGPVFRGGFRARFLNTGSGTFSTNSYGGNNTNIRVQPTTGIQANQNGVFFFDTADMADVEPTDTLTFDEASVLSISGTGLSGGRWLVREGLNYYVSESTFSGTSNNAFNNAADNGRWALFQIDQEMTFDAANAIYANRRFDSINAVGFILNVPNYSNTRFWMQWTGFGANFALNSSPNESPVPVILSDYAGLGNTPLTVNFNGNSSFDPDGEVSFFAWNFGNNTSIGGPLGSATYEAAGLYYPSLRIWDNSLVESSGSVLIEVGSQTAPNMAKLTAAWGGNMVNSSYNFRNSNGTQFAVDLSGNGLADDTMTGWEFSTTSAMTATRGTRWYGGLLNKVIGGSAAFQDRGINNNNPNDSINVRMQPSGTTAALHGALFIDKSDFFGAARSQPVTFTNGSKIVMTGISRMDFIGDLRWLIRDGETFYVSQQTFNSSNATWTAPGETDHGIWAVYDPTADSMNFDQANAVWETRTFTDITAVGFQWDRDAYLSGRTWLTFNEFYMEAEAAPLPVLQAAFNTAPAVVLPLQKITFDGSESEGAIVGWHWNFGDGSFSTQGSVVDYQYSAEGHYTVTLTVTNAGGDASSLTQQIWIGEAVEPTSGFASWAAGRFTPTELADSTVSGPLAVADDDGINNLLKYALGLPRTGTNGVLPVAMATSEDFLSISFPLYPENSDIAYIVEASDNLSGWTAIFDSRTDTPYATAGAMATVRDTVALAPGGISRFLRLRVLIVE